MARASESPQRLLRVMVQSWTAGKTDSAVASAPPALRQRTFTLVFFKAKTPLATSVFPGAGSPSPQPSGALGLRIRAAPPDMWPFCWC